jgi:formylglycine-generating enzyme required for sulfatase activity
MKNSAIGLLFLVTNLSIAQTKMIIVGDVKDVTTKEPLAYATIGVKGRVDQTISAADGRFELSVPASAEKDTLYVTYVGYAKFEKPIAQLSSNEHVLLKEFATMLEEVRIVHRQLDVRDIDREMRVIRDDLYASAGEVTNLQYHDFLSWLEDYNKPALRDKYNFDLKSYSKPVQEFYQRYHKPGDPRLDRKRHRMDSTLSFNSYPAVNISYESAVEYCKWLTDRYNESTKKKKFKKVLFRLPTLKEWQVAALGYPKFQSWELHDNEVEVIIPKDTMHIFEGQKKKLKFDDSMMYPWYPTWVFRSRVYNQYGCYLGNFKINVDRNCVSRALAYDGWTMMSRTESYFPNDMGLYDVVGNVAEMIDEKGKACGGSWNDTPENSTIQSVKNYRGPDETVGFRIFMEVIEK